jgi:large subunit ribosomal protein L10
VENEVKKSQSRIKKEETVDTLAEKIARAKSMVLADHSGLSVTASQELKRALRAVKSEFTVAKNTLLSLAAKKSQLPIPDDQLKGPTSILFSFDDEIEPIKKLSEFTKKYETPKVKVGFLQGELLTADRVSSLASLPSKDILYGKVVGSLYSPLYGLVGALSGNIRNLTYVLNAIKDSKGGAN